MRSLSLFLSFAVSFLLLRLLLLPVTQRWFLDLPNHRSLHASPVPRSGGLAIVPGALLGMLIGGGAELAVSLAAALMLVSVLDDWGGLPAAVRFVAHLAAASTFAALALPQVSWPLLAVMALTVAWVTNLYNFMDGADGLAAGMAVIGFSGYAAAAWMSGNAAFAVINLCLATASGAFLLFNFPPARMFMGDAGSIPLGFLAAALGITGWRDGTWPAWFPFVVFAPFVVDASATLARRALRGEKLWLAHHEHYYQRLVRMGWGHRRTMLAEYAFMLLCAGVALAVCRQPPGLQYAALAAVALLCGLLMWRVDRAWNRHSAC